MNYYDIFIEEIPESLSKEENLKLLKEASSNLSSRDKVITHNLRLIVKRIHQKYSDPTFDRSDLLSAGILGLISAVDSFDPNKGEFSTYAMACIDSSISDYINKDIRQSCHLSLEAPAFVGKDGDEVKFMDTLSDNRDFTEDIEQKDINGIIRKIIEKLNARDAEYIKLYFGFINDKVHTAKEIAQIKGVSGSYVSFRIKQSLEIIKSELKKEGIYEKELKFIKSSSVKTKMNYYSLFKGFLKEEIDEAIDSLSDEEKLLLFKYSKDKIISSIVTDILDKVNAKLETIKEEKILDLKISSKFDEHLLTRKSIFIP